MVKPDTTPKLTALKIVVDDGVPRDELRVHPVMYSVLQAAFQEADGWRGLYLGMFKQ